MKESKRLKAKLKYLKEKKFEVGNFFEEMAKLEKAISKEECRELDVGDGATINYYTDRHACTVIRRTKKTIVLQRDKATLCKDYKPEFIPGGFGVHCLNNSEQKWEYEADPNGLKYIGYWSEKKGCFVVDKCLTVSVGRHEFYDYNF